MWERGGMGDGWWAIELLALKFLAGWARWVWGWLCLSCCCSPAGKPLTVRPREWNSWSIFFSMHICFQPVNNVTSWGELTRVAECQPCLCQGRDPCACSALLVQPCLPLVLRQSLLHREQKCAWEWVVFLGASLGKKQRLECFIYPHKRGKGWA